MAYTYTKFYFLRQLLSLLLWSSIECLHDIVDFTPADGALFEILFVLALEAENSVAAGNVHSLNRVVQADLTDAVVVDLLGLGLTHHRHLILKILTCLLSLETHVVLT